MDPGLPIPAASTVVVGRNSMIARVLRQHVGTHGWHYVTHGQALANPAAMRSAACVINLAFDPWLKSNPYDEAFDVDLQLARMLAAAPVRYIMASTRMVYGPAHGDCRLAEDMAEQPTTAYGVSKLACERRVSGLLGDRLTILRLSNIFDSVEAACARASFFGLAMNALQTKRRISFDMSPYVARDFLPALRLAEWLSTIAAQPASGVFNLGAGFAVPTGRIAQWLIEGYGSGELLITNFREFDSFWLDTGKATRTWGFAPFTRHELRFHCVRAGELLAGKA